MEIGVVVTAALLFVPAMFTFVDRGEVASMLVEYLFDSHNVLLFPDG